ncbi:uncharacterized protein LOC117822274 isoform X2 [Xyrichtys novacula]|uniref:Uncharacterized protein LOC117822274 isoform X2 n=1 Tax=Xyrichtys novacula TaxID=13765 RepID=A0AAV1FLM0_XYRNO|nr:uncharacterized protein LOC117822274 isoform X2 [Xyrichtys novacula]
MAHFHSQGLFMIGLFVVLQGGRVSGPVDPKSCYRAQWIKNDAGQKRVVLARPKMPDVKYAERAKWEADKPGQMSLVLTKLQRADEGMYSCEICKDWDCTLVRNITLKVKYCTVLEAVRAADETPVSLPCSVGVTSGQQGPQNISWERVKGDNTVPVVSETAKSETLKFPSVSHSDSGWYRCKYKLGKTPNCSEINLQVGNNPVTTSVPVLTTSEVTMEIKKEESKGTHMPVVVPTTIIGIVAMVALILLIIYCRRNTQGASQLAQRHYTGAAVMTTTDYEVVNFTPSDDVLSQRLNSLYRDESLCTFQWE